MTAAPTTRSAPPRATTFDGRPASHVSAAAAPIPTSTARAARPRGGFETSATQLAAAYAARAPNAISRGDLLRDAGVGHPAMASWRRRVPRRRP